MSTGDRDYLKLDQGRNDHLEFVLWKKYDRHWTFLRGGWG